MVASSGHVAEIKLRCEKQYVFFHFDADVQYRIEGKYGSCEMGWLAITARSSI